MLLTINKNNKITVFEQIFTQITELINNGSLDAGTRLPSSRELAKTIGVNRTTVIRVYEELWVQGYIESTPGSYTTVRKRKQITGIPEDDDTDTRREQTIYKDHLNLLYDPIMYYLENGKSIEKGKINFLQLSPDTRLLDRKHVNASMRDALNETETNPFDFTHARGYKPLRQVIAKQMKLHNIHVEDKNILVTNGSLQSLQLIFQVFSKPGDYIAIENPTYSIMLHFIKIFRLRIIEIPISKEGMDLKVLASVLKETPVRFIYTMPTYQNPTGISMPQLRREELLHLCEDEDCIIIEDSIEEEMKYSGKAYLPIKSIDKKGQVIYLGTFTKVMALGLRIGWIIAPPECIKKLTVLKSIFEISSSTINQLFLYNFINKGAFDLHLRKTVRVFTKRMKVAVNAIKKYIPPEKIEWTEPNGGYMIWVKLLTKPMENIENHISDYGVMVHNGKYFFAKEEPHDYIRICIAQTNETEIEEGMKRIGEAIRGVTL
ncbi:MAG TPA: PLP-dependent aminotransferase family protein [Bacteroidales bacterium]